MSERQPTIELERQLGKFDATMIIVGNIIGMGIFTTTGFIAEVLPHPLLMLSVWIAGGLLTLCGALTYAELGAALPRAGGEYVYLREAYGPLMGFLNGWTYFLVSNPGSIAVMSVALVAYTQSLVPGVPMQSLLIAFEVFNWKFQVTSGQFLSIVVVGVFTSMLFAADAPLLADRHKSAGLACDACHKENPPKVAAPETACQGCHGSYEKVAQLTEQVTPHNPHQSHEGELECGECHHAHKPSVDYCYKCHQFGFKVP